MLTRRTITRLLASCGVWWLLPEPLRAQVGSVFPGQRVTLQDQLEKGLRARRPQEFLFVRRVVELVEQGHLPLPVVRSTYLWARDKRPYPFPYFQVALARRAKAFGIVLTHDLGAS